METDVLAGVFRSQIPSVEKAEFLVQFESLSGDSAPCHCDPERIHAPHERNGGLAARHEFLRRLPDSYSLVINVAHPLVSKVRSEAMGAPDPVCRADVQCHERLSGSGPQDPFGS